MNEEGAGGGVGGGAIDPAALLLAMGAHQEAREYLRKQTRLVDLHIDDMERENKLRHWSLRFGNLSAVMKVAFEIALAFIFLALAAGIAGAIWTAAHDDSLVIDAFSVPPDMANRGLTGQAVAAQLEDRLEAMQDATDTARPASSYSNNWGDDIKVQIPDTGVSISEFYRILTGWLGHQTHITGEVFRTHDGIAITARAGGNGAATESGPEAAFTTLLQQAAEAIYSRTQPYRYAIYSINHRNYQRARFILDRLAVDGETPAERAWALNGLANLDNLNGNLYASVRRYRGALATDPDFALAWSNVAEYEATLGHDEAALIAGRKTIELLQSDGRHALTQRARAILLMQTRATHSALLGDFDSTRAQSGIAATLPDYSQGVEEARESVIIALAHMHDTAAAQRAFALLPATNDPVEAAMRICVRFLATLSTMNPETIVEQERRVEQTIQKAGPHAGVDGNALEIVRDRQVRPAAAETLAAAGDFKAAHALTDTSPVDCYFCLHARGLIDSLQKNWGGAAYWFARAVGAAPSLPFAHADWGAMLMAKGDVDSAIAELKQAHAKGPRFADPLEMWGEALMQKNRSDLAVAKFEEANRYAPNWGRLHLRWGETLLWSGDKAGAAKQFTTARGLELTPPEKSELAHVDEQTHG